MTKRLDPVGAGTAQGLALLVTGALPVMGVALISPNLSLIESAFRNTPGARYLASIAMTMPALCIAAFSPLAGMIVDRIGRRFCLLSALILYGLFGTAPLFLTSLAAIIASRAGVGMVEAVIMTSAYALFADYYEDERRARWLAYNGAFSTFSGTVFYLAGGVLGQYGWRTPFLAYGLAFLMAAFVAAVIWEPVRSARADSSQRFNVFKAKGLPWVCLLGVFSAVLFFVVPLEMSVFITDRAATPAATVGAMIAVASIGNPLGSFLFRFLARLRLSHILALGYLVGGAGLIGMSLASSPTQVAAAAFVNQLGCGVLIPALIAEAMRILPVDARGQGIGALVSCMFLGQFICAPTVMALAGVGRSMDVAFEVSGVLSVFAAFVAWAVGTRLAAQKGISGT